jgi:glycosyltransferase involved in cell wall biosynthesis
MTRNESDLLRLNIVHHLQTSCDRIMVVDNDSTDKTRTILKRLAAKLPVDWTTQSGLLDQGEVVTSMVHEAHALGADWVIPLDTDEFWHSGRKLHEILAEDTESGALVAERIEFIQSREQMTSTPQGVLNATMRVAETQRGVETIDDFLAARRSMFELHPQPKVLVRATPDVVVTTGAHTTENASGPRAAANGIAVFHVPLRSKEAVFERAERGKPFATKDSDPYAFAQAQYWRSMQSEDRLAEAWAAHSYADGALDVSGQRVELVEDGRLVELLSPWIRSPRAQWFARLTGRSW